VNDRSTDTLVSRIRRNIGPDPATRLLKTVRLGVQFTPSMTVDVHASAAVNR
jgi:hypothetical protein